MVTNFRSVRDTICIKNHFSGYENRKLYCASDGLRSSLFAWICRDLAEANSDSEETWQRREGGGGEETIAEERGGGGAEVAHGGGGAADAVAATMG
jgi:hypothetical protein